ncbi:hypothetical protein HN587_00230 [Candidatus Woesearchaeota archaeon]|nr:hypothetical protein [Candidatus Woesearchaeota archaeon]
MVKKFKKSKDFERTQFFQEFEKSFADKSSKHLHIVGGHDPKVYKEFISPSELWFRVSSRNSGRKVVVMNN